MDIYGYNIMIYAQMEGNLLSKWFESWFKPSGIMIYPRVYTINPYESNCEHSSRVIVITLPIDKRAPSWEADLNGHDLAANRHGSNRIPHFYSPVI